MCCTGPHGLPTLDHARSAPARRICRSRLRTGVITCSVATVPGEYDVVENTAVKYGWSGVSFGVAADDEPTLTSAATTAAADDEADHGTTGSSVGNCSDFTSAEPSANARAEARLGRPRLAALERAQRVLVLAGLQVGGRDLHRRQADRLAARARDRLPRRRVEDLQLVGARQVAREPGLQRVGRASPTGR